MAQTLVSGAHAIVYSRDAERDRAFLREVLGFPSVDAGGGWLIFALPPSEVAVHPAASNDRHELYLMTDDVAGFIKSMAARGVECAAPQSMGWGDLTSLTLPGGGKLGVYQPRHARPANARHRSRRAPSAKPRRATKRPSTRSTRRTVSAKGGRRRR